jgi:hypothetical protein
MPKDQLVEARLRERNAIQSKKVLKVGTTGCRVE